MTPSLEAWKVIVTKLGKQTEACRTSDSGRPNFGEPSVLAGRDRKLYTRSEIYALEHYTAFLSTQKRKWCPVARGEMEIQEPFSQFSFAEVPLDPHDIGLEALTWTSTISYLR